MLGASGCRREEPITSYKVKRIEKPADPMGKPAIGAHARGEPVRFLAAMAPGPDRMWFFRLNGPEKAVTPLVKDFEEMAKTIKFVGNEPTWTTPKGWERLPGKSVSRGGITVDIHAFIRSPGEVPQQVEVSGLSLEGNSGPKGLQINLNRWRGMIGLPPVDPEEIPTVTRTIDANGVKVTLVDMEGGSGGGLPGGHPPIPKMAKLPFKADVPADWVVLPGEGGTVAFKDLRGVMFYFKQDKAEMTWAEILDQLRRKRKFEPLPEDKIRTGTTTLVVGTNKLNAVELNFKDGEDTLQLLGAQHMIGGEKWVFVMVCDSKTYERRRPQFQQFLASIQPEAPKS